MTEDQQAAFEEFKQYMHDYCGEQNPNYELTYWSHYPPYKEKGRTYAIYGHTVKRKTCSECGTELIDEIELKVEHGYEFEVTTEERLETEREN